MVLAGSMAFVRGGGSGACAGTGGRNYKPNHRRHLATSLANALRCEYAGKCLHVMRFNSPCPPAYEYVKRKFANSLNLRNSLQESQRKGALAHQVPLLREAKRNA